METQDKELLLKDLCARLPYDVKVKRPDDGSSDYVSAIDVEAGTLTVLYNGYEDYIEKFVPYLRPMSSMTEEEIKEWDNICVMMRNMPVESIPMIERFVNSKHLDYYNLISKGFALEALDGMYNINNE